MKKFDKELKKKAVELSYARGNASEIADDLGIDRSLLYRWRTEFSQYKDNSFPGHGTPKMTDLERENARLQKELREARMERDILKKAISIPVCRLAGSPRTMGNLPIYK